MTSRFLIALAALLGALTLLAACGGDDEETVDEVPIGETATDREETATDEEEAPAPDAEGAVIQLAADPGGALEFDQDSLEAPAGTVAIELTNDSEVPHNVAIERDGELIVEGEVFQGGGTRTTTAELEAGDFVFYCSVPGHREAGMEGDLTVT
jgi:plastocyanin